VSQRSCGAVMSRPIGGSARAAVRRCCRPLRGNPSGEFTRQVKTGRVLGQDEGVRPPGRGHHFSEWEISNEFSSAAHRVCRRNAARSPCRCSSQSKSSVISIGMATRAGQKSPDVGVGICPPRSSSTAKSNGMETIYRFGLSITALEYCAGFRAQQFTKFRFLAMLSRVKSHVIGLRFLIVCGQP
jgi:hypothetical protein